MNGKRLHKWALKLITLTDANIQQKTQ